MAAWKPKEKPLSKEDALALAKQQLKKDWFGSPPLLAGVATENGAAAFPLDATLGQRSWLLFFLNPMDIAGQNTIAFARDLQRRYASNNVGVLAILRPTFRFVQERAPIESWLKRHQISYPVAIDGDGLIAMSFGVSQQPSVLLLDKGRTVFKHSGPETYSETERDLHVFLRTSDPGLALLPTREMTGVFRQEIPGIDFGRGREAKFPTPGFAPFSAELSSAFFVDAYPERFTPNKLYISGRWLQDQDRILTSDPCATLGFHCPGGGLSLIAQAIAKTQESSKICVDVDGAPAFETFSGEDLIFDEEGQSAVRVAAPRLSCALTTLPPEKRQITLRFPIADRVSVAIYGVRFFEPAKSDFKK